VIREENIEAAARSARPIYGPSCLVLCRAAITAPFENLIEACCCFAVCEFFFLKNPVFECSLTYTATLVSIRTKEIALVRALLLYMQAHRRRNKLLKWTVCN
jgi:hypothetical protein